MTVAELSNETGSIPELSDPQRCSPPFAVILTAAIGMLAVVLLVVAVIVNQGGATKQTQVLKSPSQVTQSSTRLEPTPLRSTEPENGVGQILAWGVALAVAILFYLLPSFIAFFRGHHNRAAILALNILLGWIVLGWIASLVWSLTEVRSREHRHYHYHEGSRT